MKRREFLSLSVGIAGLSASAIVKSETRPCPPGTLAVSGSSGVETTCGVQDVSDWPAPGTFADVSVNVPRDVVPAATKQSTVPVYYAAEGPSGVWNDWTSGAFAPDLGSQGSYVCWGGGHNGYYGNEVYRWDVASRAWSRMGEPSPYGGSSIDSIGAFPDGKPASPHTYQTLGILSPANGGGPYGSLIQATLPAVDLGGGSRNAAWWRFDFATGNWSKWLNSSGIAAGTLGQKLMVQEPGSHFWWLGGGYVGQIARVSQAGVITKYNVEVNCGYYECGAAIPGTRVVAIHGVFAPGLVTYLLDLAAIESGATGSAAIKQVSTTGTPGDDSDGLTWCPERQAFASISSTSPATVRWLAPSSAADPWNSKWTWTSETYRPAGGAVPGPAPNGAFGRFVWVPGVKCFLWSSSVDRRMQAYRPIGV